MNVPVFKKPFSNRNSLYLILSVAGLSFLFFLGFPFHNHNESYLWIVILDKIPFIDAITTRLEPVQSFRPLGTGTAWLTYRLSGNIYLQQLFNWLFACLSFAVLFRYASNKMLFGVAAALATAGFFSGYIYLFHLHGVFYGPLQLYIALLAGLAYQRRIFTTKNLLLLFLLTSVAALYHTFALLVFAAYCAGAMLDVPKAERRSYLPKLFGLLTASLLLIYFILKQHPSSPEGDALPGTLASFTTTEINLPLHLLAAVFTLATVLTLPLALRWKQALLVLTMLLAVLFIYLRIPVLLLWILACLLKMALSRNWAVAAIIFSTAVFPAATHTGTPTYIVFVIMVCVFVTTINNAFLLHPPRLLKTGLSIALFSLLFLLVLLKAGINVPGAASGLAPVLAEQEKTQQLETILAWKKKTAAYSTYNLRFFDESSKPSASKNAVNRTNRPPTQQGYLNKYCRAELPLVTPDTTRTQPLLITFGGKQLQGRQKLFEVPGRWNGDAYVYQ